MKILLFGKNGQLGWELQRSCLALGEIVALDYPEIDLSNAKELRVLIQQVRPNVIINAAAYTNVDKAEEEAELARKVNAIAPAIMAEEIKKLSGSLVHYSTDFVFNGTKRTPYTEADAPDPINKYGATKLEGDQLVQEIAGNYLIFRTSWVYSLRQGGFVTKVLQWARTQEILRIVDDQFGSPTWARLLSEVTAQVLAQGIGNPSDYLKSRSGLYHLAGSGSCSRYEWARAILELDPQKEEQRNKQILPAKSKEFPTLAARPEFSALDCSLFEKTFEFQIPKWQKSLGLIMGSFK
jgi:dTDP-4-dehydrorhamnose reductase